MYYKKHQITVWVILWKQRGGKSKHFEEDLSSAIKHLDVSD